MPLTEAVIKAAEIREKSYRMKDTEGLFVEVRPSGKKVFRVRYWYHQRDSLVTIGEYPLFKLKDARDKRDEIRRLIANGIDPAALRAYEVTANERRLPTFGEIAVEWLARKKADSRSEKMKYILEMRLKKYILPFLSELTPDEVTAPMILNGIIRPIEEAGHLETAHRVLGICGQVFRYGVATGRASRDPSGDLRGALRPSPERHLASITDKNKFGTLLRAIYDYDGSMVVKYAMIFLSLTFVRPGELRHAEWSEIDIDASEWRIPAEKMKMRRLHVVPLSTQAIEVIQIMQRFTGHGRYVFPSARTPSGSRPMSDMAMLAALRGMGYSKEEMTAHGFRHTASTLLNESGLWSPDAIERQLAHIDRNKIRAVYNYAEYLPERRKMMQWWADSLDRFRTT